MGRVFAVLIFVSLVIVSTLQIDQKCRPLDQVEACPENSYCELSGFCSCDVGWVLDCQTQSALVNKSVQTFNLSSQVSYYTIVPSEKDLIFVYKFTFCTKRK